MLTSVHLLVSTYRDKEMSDLPGVFAFTASTDNLGD
jgi:hypothetical protein